MILLDTNVVSAVMAPAPTVAVVAWLNRQDSESLFLSTISLAEIGYGLHVLPDGRRRRDLLDRFDRLVTSGFEDRILSFDEASASVYGEVMGRRKKLGRPLAALDGQIAAIARSRRLAVATRNLRDFEDCGVEVIDPVAG